MRTSEDWNAWIVNSIQFIHSMTGHFFFFINVNNFTASIAWPIGKLIYNRNKMTAYDFKLWMVSWFDDSADASSWLEWNIWIFIFESITTLNIWTFFLAHFSFFQWILVSEWKMSASIGILKWTNCLVFCHSMAWVGWNSEERKFICEWIKKYFEELL